MLEKKIKRKRRTTAERRTLYDLWQKSGLNGSEFCRQNHISTRTIWKWRKEFGSEAANANSVVAYPIGAIGTQQTTKDIKFYPLSRLSNNDDNHNNNNVDNKNGQQVVDRNSLLEIMLPTGSIYKTYLSEASIKTILNELLK